MWRKDEVVMKFSGYNKPEHLIKIPADIHENGMCVHRHIYLCGTQPVVATDKFRVSHVGTGTTLGLKFFDTHQQASMVVEEMGGNWNFGTLDEQPSLQWRDLHVDLDFAFNHAIEVVRKRVRAEYNELLKEQR